MTMYETGNDATGKADDVRANFIPRHKHVTRARQHQRVSRLAVTECEARRWLDDDNRRAWPQWTQDTPLGPPFTRHPCQRVQREAERRRQWTVTPAGSCGRER